LNDLDGFEGDFSPVSQFNGDIILFKDSRSFHNEYTRSFGGKPVRPEIFNKPDGVHQFYSKNQNNFLGDHFVVIKAKTKN